MPPSPEAIQAGYERERLQEENAWLKGELDARNLRVQTLERVIEEQRVAIRAIIDRVIPIQ